MLSNEEKIREAARTYLDYNATAPMKQAAHDVFLELASLPLNPSSIHHSGRMARKVLEQSRSDIAKALGARCAEIIFTASGTEANNLVIASFDKIVISATEHASIIKPAEEKAIVAGVDSNGIINLAELENALKISGSKTLVSVMLANNETGVIQPLAEVVALAKKYGALVHTDASQALAKISLDFSELDVDFMTISSHKCGGPLGAAALIARDTDFLKPILLGGRQESGRRAGTENVIAVAGFAAVCRDAENDIKIMQQVEKWRDELEDNLMKFGADTIIHGKKAARLPNTTSMSIPGIDSQTLLMAFDLEGVSVSSGSACASGAVKPSHVLLAMGVAKDEVDSSIRVSSGWKTTRKDYELFLEACKKIQVRKIQRSKAKNSKTIHEEISE